MGPRKQAADSRGSVIAKMMRREGGDACGCEVMGCGMGGGGMEAAKLLDIIIYGPVLFEGSLC